MPLTAPREVGVRVTRSTNGMIHTDWQARSLALLVDAVPTNAKGLIYGATGFTRTHPPARELADNVRAHVEAVLTSWGYLGEDAP